MLGSKIDLFGNEWLDVVFDKKNKSYGAYMLRRQSDSDTVKALFIAGTLFILLFLSPRIISLIKGSSSVEDVQEQKVAVTIQPPPAVDPKTPPPAAVEPPKAKENTLKFPPPIVVDKVVNEDPPQIKELEVATPGQKTIVGEPDGEIVVTGPTGEGVKRAAMVEDNTIHTEFAALEVQPMFPGGINKFYAYLSKAIRYPAMAQENGVQGKVFMSFIIEKDGSLTDIKVERKLGAGTDEEAIRVLKASPHWLPGIQNGNKVRVKYNIPISFALSQ
ncbi:energy transducer TonB [Pedobacter lusitanus]|uniref:Contig6, whole genome shotgun sequence n=1 Tax=Pedobacter lusitanus TaxID=1503925 RepID=A0A0D0FAH9_9SPHI|nr:energy transducer TonB [Pedobacter lusitanus]KIO78813.1 energy transducer TonB [Pedobacter lusitanus]